MMSVFLCTNLWIFVEDTMDVVLTEVRVMKEADVVFLRQRASHICKLLGIEGLKQTRFATAISEVGRTVFMHTTEGMATFTITTDHPACIRVAVCGEGAEVKKLQHDANTPSSKNYFSGCGRLVDRFTVSDSADTIKVLLDCHLNSDKLVTQEEIQKIIGELQKVSPPNQVDIIRQQNGELMLALQKLKEQQAELQISEEKEREARSVAENAVHARDAMLNVVSHDLRNPLNTISLSTDLLQSTPGSETNEQQARLINTIARSVKTMDRLIRDLFDLGSLQAGQLTVEITATSLTDVLLESEEQMVPIAAKAELTLFYNFPTDLNVMCDRSRFLQILSNLIGNAIKFTSPGGQIYVGATHEEDDLCIVVTDTGQGIAAEQLPYIFDRFRQTGTMQKAGMGLGLSIVKGLVEAQNGKIWVESGPGKGSAFYFTLPASKSSLTSDPSAK